jgi:tRNA threonylcarbamoyl adenosine modification protein (Sua5/YciO/YrdC/YwlC family)
MFLRINPDKIDYHELEKAVTCLQSDGVIIYPTDTVYAMGCNINNTKGFERVCKIKNIRPEKANFSIICHDLSHLSDYTKPISNSLFRIMKRALPGPYTFILPAGANVPKIFKTNKKTIGIRVPDNLIVREIVRLLGHPLLSTSVHDDDDAVLEYYTDPETIYGNFKQKIELMVDGGYGNIFPSTVLDCTGDEIIVVRQGLGETAGILD